MAEKTMDQRMAEAREAGYTDDEIQAYLNPNAGPPVLEAPDYDAKRREEQIATAELGAAQVLGTAGLGYGGYRGAKSLINQYNQGRPAAPAATPAPAPAPAPAPMERGGQNLRDFTAQQGRFTPPASPTTVPPGYQPGQNVNINVGGNPAPQAPGMMDRFAQMAQQYAPILSKAAPLAKGAGAVGALTYSPGLNTGEQDELIRQRARIEAAIRMEAARKAGIQ